MKNTAIKPVAQQMWFQLITAMCIMLTFLTSHQVVWAYMTEPQSTSVALTNTGWRMLVPQSSDANGHPTILVQNTAIDMKYISNVILEGDRTLRFLVWDKTRIDEVRTAVRSINANIVVSVENENLVIVFPVAIVESLRDAMEGQSINLSKLSNGNGGTSNSIWACLFIIAGIGVGTYYAFKWLCKQAGLIPTNSPPPSPPPPPPPPSTNIPPRWTNGPITIVSGGSFKMTSLVTGSVMPLEVQERLLGGTSSTNPLFRVESGDPFDETMYGIASFDASDWNSRYGSSSYMDPSSAPYIRCLRTILQSKQALSSTGTNTNWQTLVTMYIWINDSYACFSLYDDVGALQENTVVQKDPYGQLPPTLAVQGFEHMITHTWNPQGAKYFRIWSGLPTTP